MNNIFTDNFKKFKISELKAGDKVQIKLDNNMIQISVNNKHIFYFNNIDSALYPCVSLSYNTAVKFDYL